jgi:hypothetical protein
MGGMVATDHKGNIVHDHRTKHAERFSEGHSTLRDVEIFAAGEHRGKRYNSADLDEMVENFQRFSQGGKKPGFRVPLVIGHEESQDFLDRSDLPAAGWASKVYRAGDTLKADFDDVPEKVARLLRGKAYRTVSSEVYDQPPEGLPKASGKMLRRVALLGGDIPQLKDLEEIPTPERHSEKSSQLSVLSSQPTPGGQRTAESGKRRFASFNRVHLRFRSVKPSRVPGAFWCFSEATMFKSAPLKALQAGRKRRLFDEGQVPGRDEIIQHLAETGMDADKLQQAPDEALAEMARYVDSQAATDDDADADADDQPPPEPSPPTRADSNNQDDGGDGGEPDAYDEADPLDGLAGEALDNLPKPGSAADATKLKEHVLKYANRQKRINQRVMAYMEAYCGDKMQDMPMTSAAPAAAPARPFSSTNGRQPSKTTVTHQYSEARQRQIIREEIQALHGGVKSDLAKLMTFREEQIKTETERTATARRAKNEELVQQLVKEGRVPPAERNAEIETLYALDDSNVQKFSENGKTVSLTARDLHVRMLKNRPSKFTEHFKEPALAGAAASDDALGVVLSYYDKHAEDCRKNGITPEAIKKEWAGLSDANKATMLQEYRRGLMAP